MYIKKIVLPILIGFLSACGDSSPEGTQDKSIIVEQVPTEALNVDTKIETAIAAETTESIVEVEIENGIEEETGIEQTGSSISFYTSPKGYAQASKIWSTNRLRVCWENFDDSTAANRDGVRAAIERTWEAHSSVEFYGWGECGSYSSNIRIGIEDTTDAPSSYVGTDSNNRYSGMTFNFTYNNWSTSGCRHRAQICNEIIAVHEFGHALGFHHEQNRTDTPGACLIEHPREVSTGYEHIGDWDEDSVMNYCNPNWSGGGVLSEGDIRTVQAYYSREYNGFESGSLNGWTQASFDTHDWSLRQNSTPSSSTGPDNAEVGDVYAYLETSSYAAYYAGDYATLTSPLIGGEGRHLQFDYHMYGSNMGTLSVDVYSARLKKWVTNVWSKTGQQNTGHTDDWHRADVNLESYAGDIYVRIKAVAAGGWKGDIAIDSLAIITSGEDVDDGSGNTTLKVRVYAGEDTAGSLTTTATYISRSNCNFNSPSYSSSSYECIIVFPASQTSAKLIIDGDGDDAYFDLDSDICPEDETCTIQLNGGTIEGIMSIYGDDDEQL